MSFSFKMCLCASLLLGIGVACNTNKPVGNYDRILLTVKRNYKIPKNMEEATLTISWDSLLHYLPVDAKAVKIVDQNFGKEIQPDYVDTDNDGITDNIVFNYSFDSNEPIFSFLITPTDELPSVKQEAVEVDKRFEFSFLTPFKKARVNAAFEDAKDLVESTMHIYPDTHDFPVYGPGKWNYEYGFFFTGCYKLGKETNNQSYIKYSKGWIDAFIKPEGGFKEGEYEMSEYKLDDILPGRLAILMYQETNDPKYKSICDTLRLHLSRQPKTSDGGYWHKKIYEHQMWLDGIFMADVFSTQYAKAFNDPSLFDEAAHQITLVYKHTLDSVSGLMYHGWDEAKNPVWADPVKGTSPEFWGRAVGWYMMALVECLDYIPKDHPERDHIETILRNLSASVLSVRDKETGLWFQVLDKGSQEGNWIETSCSAMFAYAFAKGAHMGILDDSFAQTANQVVDSLFSDYIYVDHNNNLHLNQTVKVGTLNTKNSNGDFNYYVTTERRLDDYKGISALLFACIELKR